MLEIVHSGSDIGGWRYECRSVPAIAGAAQTYEESVDQAGHDARFYLERQHGRPLEELEVSELVTHYRERRSSG